MAYVFYNPNPDGQFVGDCVVRAISKLFNYSWERAYSEVVLQGHSIQDRMIAHLEDIVDSEAKNEYERKKAAELISQLQNMR